MNIVLPLQKFLQEGASLLRYTYIDCLIVTKAIKTRHTNQSQTSLNEGPKIK